MHAPTPIRTRLRRSLTGAAAALLACTVPAASAAGAPDATAGVVAATGAAAPSAPPSRLGTTRAPAADTVVVVVSSESSVSELSRVELSDLYLGRRSSFPNGQAAEPIDQEPGSQARRAFYEAYLGRSESEIKAHWSKAVFTGRGRPPRDVENGEEMKELLAANPRAVGYIDRSLVDDRVRVVRVTGLE